MAPMPETPVIRSRVFDGLTDVERQEWLDASTVVRLAKGDVLARQGDPAQRFCLVETGFLKLLQITADGTEVIVRFVGPAEPFGGVTALGGRAAFPVTAVATQATVVRNWTHTVVADLLTRHPQVRINVMREMAAHMTEALTRVRELTTERVDQRLAQALLRLSRQCGEPEAGGILITQPLTRQELANLTGATLYTVSRTLAGWEARGLVASRSRRLLLRSPKTLEALAEEDDE